MATIQLTSNDIKKMIHECIERVLSESPYDGLDDVVSGEELTDAALKNGFNLIGYHNTNDKDLNRYGFYKRSSGIHFGSLKAANDRGKQRDSMTGSQNWTHKYFLKVVNPLVIEKDFDWEFESFDEWSSPDDDAFYDDINIDKYLEDHGFNIFVRDENGEVMYDQSIEKAIGEKGYDCIIYKNEREDAGRYSIAMFNPCNIKLAQETFDNNGNPIPIGQRFNTNTNDVRY